MTTQVNTEEMYKFFMTNYAKCCSNIIELSDGCSNYWGKKTHAGMAQVGSQLHLQAYLHARSPAYEGKNVGDVFGWLAHKEYSTNVLRDLKESGIFLDKSFGLRLCVRKYKKRSLDYGMVREKCKKIEANTIPISYERTSLHLRDSGQDDSKTSRIYKLETSKVC